MPRQLKIAPSATRNDPILLTGGLDLVTPLSSLKPGRARDALNYEQSVSGGYGRIAGYERFSGQPKPSAATYSTLTLFITAPIAVGQTITGATSGATGVLIYVSGPIVAYTKAAGVFVQGETITVGGAPKATLSSLGGASVGLDFDALQRALAANVYRADIAAPPGSGRILGGVVINGVCYALRNNAGATAAAIWRESSTGWQAVTLGSQISFTAGSNDYMAGDTITQGGVSALVRSVAVESGSWLAGTAAGHLVLTGITGGSFAAGAAAGGGVATLSGAATAIALAPGGRWEFDFGNFGLGRKAYGADGVNEFAIEFDGTTVTPIYPGVAGIAPAHPLVHQDHLFLCFDDLLQHSGIAASGGPFNWTSVAGAAVYRCGSRIHAITKQPGNQSAGAMSITMEDETEMLYGTSAANFSKVSFEESAGGRPYGVQKLGNQTLMYGDMGVMTVAASQSFGNFTTSSLTMNIRPFTAARRTTLVASLVNREKSQYRAFFSDGYGLYSTIVNGRMIGSMPVYFPNAVACAWRGKRLDGIEQAYFGGENGMVYQLDVGTSCDGASIGAFLTLVYAAQGNQRSEKFYRGAVFEVQGTDYAEFAVTAEFEYGSLERQQLTSPSRTALNLSAIYWDSPAMVWDHFTWDSKTLSPAACSFEGRGLNIAMRIDSESDAFAPFTLNSVIIPYRALKALRRA